MAPPATASHLALHAHEVIAPALVGSRARVHFAGENTTTAAAADSPSCGSSYGDDGPIVYCEACRRSSTFSRGTTRRFLSPEKTTSAAPSR